MSRTFSLELGEEIKSDIGNQVIMLLMFLFMILAIYLSDANPANHNIYVMPVVTLSLLFLVILTLSWSPRDSYSAVGRLLLGFSSSRRWWSSPITSLGSCS